MATGVSLVARRTFRNKDTSAVVSGLAAQPRGLREKICTVSQPVSCATTKALCSPPLIGAWNPMRGLLSGRELILINQPQMDKDKQRIRTNEKRRRFVWPVLIG